MDDANFLTGQSQLAVNLRYRKLWLNISFASHKHSTDSHTVLFLLLKHPNAPKFDATRANVLLNPLTAVHHEGDSGGIASIQGPFITTDLYYTKK
jgi:hypothetical protein